MSLLCEKSVKSIQFSPLALTWRYRHATVMVEKIGVVFGGTDGLGAELATALLSHMHVVVIGRSQEKLSRMTSRTMTPLQADLTDTKQAADVVTTVMQRFGRIDCAIFSAGLWLQGMTGEYSARDIESVIQLNLITPMYLTQLIAPIMIQQQAGQLVYIVSKDATYAKTNRSIYHASKWGLSGYTQCLREDLAETPVRVLAVYPGLMKTGLFAKSGAERDFSKSLDPAVVANAIVSTLTTSSGETVTELHLDA